MELLPSFKGMCLQASIRGWSDDAVRLGEALRMLETRYFHRANEKSNSVWFSGQILQLRIYIAHAFKKIIFDKKLFQ